MSVTTITVALAVDVDEGAWARLRAYEDAQDRLVLGAEQVREWASLAEDVADYVAQRTLASCAASCAASDAAILSATVVSSTGKGDE